MVTALECRRESELYLEAARSEADTGIRTALLGLNRNWATIASQIDWLATLRESKRPS
jgi:hypothetical protein